MSILIDTGAFVAARNADDERHERGKELLEETLQGGFGEVYTSDYVVDEATTLALVRTGRPELAVDVGSFCIDSPRIRILHIPPRGFNEAWKRFKDLAEDGLSFTDCTTLWLVHEHHIEEVLSFDSGFDGLVPRLH